MIDKQEILEAAGKFNLQPHIVEKDYALGWFLAGINAHPELSNSWIFKGGTCLKKCYFETYRFSEDLDFTVIDPAHIEASFLTKKLSEVALWIEEQTGMAIPSERIIFDVYANPRGSQSVEGKASYRGPLQSQTGLAKLPRIKFDLVSDEELVLTPNLRKVHHPYSDAPTAGISVLTYRYEEVFAEKTRALAERLRPRDLYDVVHLYRRMDLNPDQAKILSTLQRKCANRGIAVPTIDSIQTHKNRAFLESEWETMLAHQLPELPAFGQFLEELPQVLDWISGINSPIRLESIVEETDEATEFRQELPEVFLPDETSNFEKIRFAASNRLCINLGYAGSARLIHPYAFVRSSDGNLILRAVKHDTLEARSYRMDRVQTVGLTRVPFIPAYDIEISSDGPLKIRQLIREAPASYNRGRPTGPKYIFRCSTCKKIFRRSTHDSTLRRHKNKSGHDCYGTYGIFLRKEY